VREMAALRTGREPDPPGESVARRLAVLAAAGADADAFRAFLATRSCLMLERELWEDPRVTGYIRGGDGVPRALSVPGPDREQLLRLVAGRTRPSAADDGGG
jgi:hypothetical protein